MTHLNDMLCTSQVKNTPAGGKLRPIFPYDSALIMMSSLDNAVILRTAQDPGSLCGHKNTSELPRFFATARAILDFGRRRKLNPGYNDRAQT